MIKILFTSVFLCSCLSVTGQTGEGDEISMMYLSRMEKFQNAGTPEDQARIYVDYITEDAIWMPQNQEIVVGRDEIYEWAVWFFSTYKFFPNPGEPRHDKSLISGDMAVHRFTSDGIYIIRATNDTVPYSQKYLDILKKTDGQWKIAIHMWSSNTTGPGVWNIERPH